MAECEAFTELKDSNVIDNRSGCLAIITRDKESNCIEGVGETLKFCPYCGKRILSEFNGKFWRWWHE